MPDRYKALRLRFAQILRSQACMEIDFWLGGLHVSGCNLTVVAIALERNAGRAKHGINVKIEPQTENAAASYDTTRDVVQVPNLQWATSDRFEQLAVVHECTHALRDVHGATLSWNGRPYSPRAATDEAAAYVAGCLYDIYRHGASDSPDWLRHRKSPIHALAYEIARRQAKRPAGSPVSREDFSLLTAGVRRTFRKAGDVNRKYVYDGIVWPRKQA